MKTNAKTYTHDQASKQSNKAGELLELFIPLSSQLRTATKTSFSYWSNSNQSSIRCPDWLDADALPAKTSN